MNRPEEIRFMKARLIRLASQEWNMSLDEVLDVFTKNNVLQYITLSYGIFHVEGDFAILEDIKNYLAGRGVAISV